MDAQDWRIGYLRSERATEWGRGSAEEEGSRRMREHLCSLLFQYFCAQATTTAGCGEGMGPGASCLSTYL
jgi:hypothetical protein